MSTPSLRAASGEVAAARATLTAGGGSAADASACGFPVLVDAVQGAHGAAGRATGGLDAALERVAERLATCADAYQRQDDDVTDAFEALARRLAIRAGAG